MVVKDQLLEALTPEGAEMFSKKLGEAENFFKHADRDADASYDFRPGQTEMMLLDVYMKYRELTGETLPLLGLYYVWFWVVVAKDLVLPEALRDRIRETAKDPAFTSRERFFREWSTAAFTPHRRPE